MEIIEPKRTSLRISKKEEQCIKEETENLESRKPQRKGKQKKDTEEPENEEETIVKRRKNKKNSTSQKNVEDSEHEDEVTTKKRKNKKNDASKKDVTDESEHEVEATVKRKYCKKTDYSNGSNMNKKKAKHLKLAASVVNEDENVKEEPTVPTLKLKLKKGRPRLNKEENWEDVTNEKKTKSTKVESFAQEEDEQKGSDGCGQPTPSTKKVTKGRKKKAEKIKTAKARKKNKESSTENKCENEISTTDQTTSDAKPLNNNSEEDEILEKRIEKLKKISDEKVEEEEEMKKKKKTLKRGWMNEVDISNITPVTGPESSGIRQSRRIAQLKIKEQAETGKYVDTVTASKKSSLSNQKSKMATPTKKLNKFAKKSSKSKLSKEESDEELYYEKSSAKKKKKKKDGKPKKNFDPHKAWKGKQSSDSSSEEEEEEDHFEEEDDDIAVFDASDHEFSPESGIDDDEDYQPVKRARTAYSKPRTEDKPERDDLSCQRCGTAEQPEWILLCDVCDEGWHAACLKPPILAIPEGDWFCPPCQHNKLITNLQKFLKTYDKALNKKTNEELRRKRLEYVDISFSNIIVDQPIKKGERSQTSKVIESENSASSSDEESEEEEEEEPLYQLRVRRQMNVSHRLNEYEELMSSAIERDVNDGIFPKASAELHSSVSTPIAPDVLDTSLVSTAAAEEATADKDQEKNESIIDEESKEEVKKVAPVVLQLRNIRKKPPRLTNLDVSSEDDHYSDEDFKGSSAEELEDDDEYEKSESDSDDRAPVRRSTRARVTRYDNDFINDDSDEDDEQDNRSNRNKKKRVIYSESDSEEEDSTWGKRKRNKHSQSHRPAKKKRRRIQFDSDSDNDRKKKPKKTSRVTYGLDESDDNFSQRRTRGKKINYLENLGSDSEEETTSRTNNKFRKILSDDDDDYVDEEEQKQNTGDNIPHKIVDKKESINDLETCSEQVNLKGLTSDSAESVTNKSPTKIVTNELNLTLEKPICNNSSPIKITDKSPEQTRSVSNGNLEFSECQTNNIKSDDFEEKNTNSQNISKMDVPVFSGVVETDNKPLLKNIDTNPSLQGMQSMTQNLSQVTSSNSFSPASLSQDPKYSTLISGPSGPVPVNYADVGITYEDPEGASISPDDKYALPIRVVSPSKLYSIQEGPPINRPSLPPFASGPRIQEPPMQSLQGSVGILPTNANRPMPTAVPIRGTRPMSGTPVTVSSHVLPPSSVNVSQCGPPSISEASPKRRPRGRGKKQLEMERLQRERESMDINRTGDEMMPLHLLKVSPSEMNTVRPPLPFSSPSGQPPPPFNNYQRIPFSQAPPSSSQQQPSSCISINTGNSSKRVKITPVRMRMPNTSQNVMRFSRPPGSAGIYGSAHHSVDSSLSPTAGQDIAGDGKVTAPTSVPGSPVVSTVPVKSEPHMSHVGMKGGDCPPSEQYYLQPPYPPSQILRGYNARHEFPYSRKTVPNMYQQPHISSVSPTSGATVTTRASGFVNSKLPTVSSPNIKTEGSMTTVIKSPPVVPRPYSLPSHVPPSTSSVPTTTKISQNAPYVSSPSSSQSHSEAQGPPTSTPPSSAYQMLHMKSPQSSASTSLPYTPPYYTSSIMQSSYPVPSSQPSSISFSHSAPSNNYSNQLVGRTPIPQSSYKPEASSASPVSVGSSAECITATSSPSEYLTPTSQSNDFQYSENQQTVVAPSESDNSIEYDGSSFNESSTTYNEESQPAEETSTGEFGGLVSYFSSQREDDLDT